MDNNILVEREFDIASEGQTYKVKAEAVFVTYSFTPREVGYYHFDFTFRGKWAEAFQ
jgi:hypothetical protein